MITVPLAELLDRLPAQYRKEAPADQTRGRMVELPCSDLLAGNTPRLSLGQLKDLVPDLVVVSEGDDQSQRVILPSGWLALHYRLVTRFEEILPEKQSSPPTAIPQAAPLRAEESAKKTVPVRVLEAEVIAKIKSEDASSMEKSIMEKPSARNEQSDKTEQVGEIKEGDKAASQKNKPPQPDTPEEVPSAEPKRGFFASLPIFRRNVNAKPPAEERGLVVLPTDTTETTKPRSLKSREPLESLDALKPLTPLWKLDPLDQLADPAALQALFMTEEKLTLDRVIAMAGQLPGLRACILAHGDQVVCASNTPPGVDLQNLSGQAMTMLAQIRESSSKMGFGNVPGVTLHADQGALSFLHNKELCLLVLHGDRGFLPGVRERLQEMLGHLSCAEALPGGPSPQTSLPI